jgi:hypothetical protein
MANAVNSLTDIAMSMRDCVLIITGRRIIFFAMNIIGIRMRGTGTVAAMRGMVADAEVRFAPAA